MEITFLIKLGIHVVTYYQVNNINVTIIHIFLWRHMQEHLSGSVRLKKGFLDFYVKRR